MKKFFEFVQNVVKKRALGFFRKCFENRGSGLQRHDKSGIGLIYSEKSRVSVNFANLSKIHRKFAIFFGALAIIGDAFSFFLKFGASLGTEIGERGRSKRVEIGDPQGFGVGGAPRAQP